jgi:signal peptidase I
MADQTPDPAPSRNPSEFHGIQARPSDDGQAPRLPPASSASWVEEVQRTLRWFLGMLLVLVAGWGFILASYLLAGEYDIASPELVALFAAVLSLGFLLLLERKFWLSGFMGLRLLPGVPDWGSALVFWVFGVVGLFFRSTQTTPQVENNAGQRPGSDVTDSAREVIETVVFVVVLVLLLKSFVAEAFVIPTGSMAETLWGAQKAVVCPDCGVMFPVNCSSEVEPPDDYSQRIPIKSGVCPNCRKKIHFGPSTSGDRIDSDEAQVPNPDCDTGDRVLVAKFLYDLLGRKPDRLDVVVFKFPGEDSGKAFPWESGPVKRHVPVNYIKRLIGLPGETIAIHRGKLFYLTPEKSPRYRDLEGGAAEPGGNGASASQAPVPFIELWHKRYMHADDRQVVELFQKGAFEIIRKNPLTLLAMKRLVYDNDHPSTDPELRAPKYQRWVAPDPGWQAHGAHGFRTGAEDSGTLRRLVYRHVLRGSEGSPQLITDFMGYNKGNGGHGSGENWATDLILECEARVESSTGELALEVSRGPDRFQARFDLSTGFCTLYRITGDQEEKLESVATRVKGKGTYRLRLANVDDRLLVWVNNRLPFGGQGVSYASPATLVPTRENDLERPASVLVRGAAVSVDHLKLFRDTYYTLARDGHPNNADERDFRPDDSETWKSLGKTSPATFYVQPGHFLCMGDNSPESSDGRSWGLVPERLMLGKAMLVYFPVYGAPKIDLLNFPIIIRGFYQVNRAGRIR